VSHPKWLRSIGRGNVPAQERVVLKLDAEVVALVLWVEPDLLGSARFCNRQVEEVLALALEARWDDSHSWIFLRYLALVLPWTCVSRDSLEWAHLVTSAAVQECVLPWRAPELP